MVTRTNAEFGMRNAELNRQANSALRTPHSAWLRGQATLELTVAMIGALIFLVAAVKVVLWSTERFVTRTQNYDRARTQAASVPESTNADWDGSYEPTKKLEILK